MNPLHLLYVLLSYLIGSIPTGLVLARSTGVDIRRQGSGNIGATNVTRLLGKKLGILTLVGDMLKALLPMVAANHLTAGQPDQQAVVLLSGGAAFLGHLFPLYLRFKGGKGVATALGVFLFIDPAAIVLSIALFGAVVALSGYVSVGSLLVSALMPLWIFIFGGSSGELLLALMVAACIWWAHRENIRRLLRGEEKSWKRAAPGERP